MIRNLATITNRFHLRSTGAMGNLRVAQVENINLFNSRGIHETTTLKQMNMVKEGHMQTMIKKTESTNLVESNTNLDSNVNLDDVEICVDGRRLIFNLTWLRDSCHCNKCTHQYSRQRLVSPKDFHRSMFSVKDIQLKFDDSNPSIPEYEGDSHSTGRYLNISWADGHESDYPFNWLQYVDSLYEKSQLDLKSSFQPNFIYPKDDFYLPTDQNTIQLDYWNAAELSSKLQPIDYHDLIEGFKYSDLTTFINANKISDMSSRRFNAMKSLTQQLVTLGLAKIVNAPQERNQVLNIARSLAYERPTGYGTVFDVVVEPNEEINLAYSSLEFDLHSDLTYRETSPGVQILHCIRKSDEGGLSYFSDSFKAAKTLLETEPNLFKVLLQYPATFVVRDPYRNVKFRRQQPVLSLDFQGNIGDVHYSPFMLPPIGWRDDVKLFYLAFDKFTQLLQSPDNKVIAKMDPGDVFIFHNRRVLHGRSAYDAKTSSRFLQGCYMDWDEIKSLHEKLYSHKHGNRQVS